MADDHQPLDVHAQARAGWHYIKSRYGPGSSVDFRTHYHQYANGDIVRPDVLLDGQRADQLAERDRAAVLNAWTAAHPAADHDGDRDVNDCHD